MDVRGKIELLPHSPGVYRYYDDKGPVIYVGKAKDLYKRVHQYFVDPARLSVKTRLLVSRIADVQYSVVETESDENLPSTVNTMKPINQATPTPNPDVTPTPSPTPAEANWSYPSASAPAQIETLPEDEWVRTS